MRCIHTVCIVSLFTSLPWSCSGKRRKRAFRNIRQARKMHNPKPCHLKNDKMNFLNFHRSHQLPPQNPTIVNINIQHISRGTGFQRRCVPFVSGKRYIPHSEPHSIHTTGNPIWWDNTPLHEQSNSYISVRRSATYFLTFEDSHMGPMTSQILRNWPANCLQDGD